MNHDREHKHAYHFISLTFNEQQILTESSVIINDAFILNGVFLLYCDISHVVVRSLVCPSFQLVNDIMVHLVNYSVIVG